MTLRMRQSPAPFLNEGAGLWHQEEIVNEL